MKSGGIHVDPNAVRDEAGAIGKKLVSCLDFSREKGGREGQKTHSDGDPPKK